MTTDEGELPARPPTLPTLPLSADPLKQFLDWERRGRGWQMWDHPAYLEPPFRPFFYFPPDQLRPSASNNPQEYLAAEPPTTVPTPDWLALLEEPTLPPYEDSDRLIELQMRLPKFSTVTPEVFSTLLVMIADSFSPFSFEIIGTAGEIVVQLVVRDSDADMVAKEIHDIFPEVTVNLRTQYLIDLWLDDTSLPAAVADLGLTHEFIRPLPTLSLGADPLVAVTRALSNLQPGEIGVLQVQFESVHYPWAESILRALITEGDKAVFTRAQEMISWARDKIRSPFFATLVRVAAKSEDENRTWEILAGLAGALTVHNDPTTNKLSLLSNEGYDDPEHQKDLLLRQTHRSGMLLNLEELVSLVHFPKASLTGEEEENGREKSTGAAETKIVRSSEQENEVATPIAHTIPSLPTLDEAIKAREAKEPQTQTPTPAKEKTKLVPPPTPGRGGAEHKGLQQRVVVWAQGMDWKADVEYPIRGGAVDVKLERPPLTVACQIAVTTPADYEAASASKCLAAGFNHVVIVSENRDHLKKIRQTMEPNLDAGTAGRLQFVTFQEFFAFMEQLQTETFDRESTVRGFKVQVKRAARTASDKTGQRQGLMEIALKKPKKDEKK